MNLAVVIPTHNRCSLLRRTLACIREQVLPEAIRLTTIVVNDGSSDETAAMLKNEFPGVLTIQGNGSWWWTRCVNEGLRKAISLGCERVLLLNDDNEIKPRFLSALVSDADSVPQPSLIGCISASLDDESVLCFSGTKCLIRWRLKVAPLLPLYQPTTLSLQGVHPSFTLSGRGMLIPAKLIENIGFLDEKLVQYASDDDFALRAAKSGYKVYVSWNAVIYTHTKLTAAGAAHLKGPASAFFFGFLNRYSVNSIAKAARIYYKHGVKVLTPVYLAIFIFGTIKARFHK